MAVTLTDNLFLWTVPEVDVLGWTGVQCTGPELGVYAMATEFLGACAVYYAPEYPVCRNVGSIIPYRAVERMLQVKMHLLQ